MRKPWWWVGLLGLIATFFGIIAVAVAAETMGYSPAFGALIGGVGGVNATWLWNPVQKAVKGIVGALKGKFTGGGSDGSADD